MPLIVRLAAALSRFSERFVPSSFAIAVLLSVVTAAGALGLTTLGPREILGAWGGGLWDLLGFGMQMALVLFGGYVLAVAPSVDRSLGRIAALPGSPRGAVTFVAVVSMLLGLLNWGVSVVASAVLVRHVGRRRFADGSGADYPLLVAAAYFGLGATWHAGLSASAPLTAATQTAEITKKTIVVPISETMFSTFNLALAFVVVVVLAAVAWALHPAPDKARPIDPQLVEGLDTFTVPARRTGSLAAWLDHSRALNVVLAAAAVAFAIDRIVNLGTRAIDLNFVNLALVAAGVAMHPSPSSVLAAADRAAGHLGGIVLQFPLYAGIAGIFRASGLNQIFGDVFVHVANARTLPLFVYWYSGVVNYFVPSGGVKWAIEAPYVIEAATRLGVEPAKMVLAYAWGDMATDLIQPFWALPLLAIARLEFKDILGPLAVACAIYVAVVSAAFAIWM